MTRLDKLKTELFALISQINETKRQKELSNDVESKHIAYQLSAMTDYKNILETRITLHTGTDNG